MNGIIYQLFILRKHRSNHDHELWKYYYVEQYYILSLSSMVGIMHIKYVCMCILTRGWFSDSELGSKSARNPASTY